MAATTDRLRSGAAEESPPPAGAARLQFSRPDAYQTLVETANIGIWHVTADGRTLYANPAVCRMLEVDSADELAGALCYDLFTPESRAVVQAEHEKRRTGIPSDYEVELAGRRGGRRTVLISGRPLLSPQGRVESMIGTVVDITDRKRTERELLESRAQLHALVESLPVGVWALDADGRCTMQNSACRPHWGNLLGKRLEEMGLPPETLARAREHHDRVMAGEIVRLEQELAHPGGINTYFTVIAPILQGGRPCGSVGAILDLTDQKRAERALAQSRAQLHALVESLPFEVWASDASGRCQMQNPAARARWGDLVGRAREDMGLPPAVLEVARRNSARALAGEVVRGESQYVVGGVPRTYFNIVAPIVQEGRTHGTVGVSIDLTEQKRAEQALRNSEELNRRILETVPGGVVRVAADGGILQANAEAQRMLGLSFNELTRMYVSQWDGTTIREDGTPFPAEEYPVSRCLATGQPQPPATLGIRRPDGTIAWAVFTAVPVKDPDTGRASGAVVTFLDLTERKRAEEALRDSARFTEQIIAHARDGIVVYDRSLRFVVWNSVMEELSGMPAAQVLGRRPLELFPMMRDNGTYELVQRALGGEIVVAPDLPYTAPQTGRSGWISCRFGPHRDSRGAVTGVIAVVHDITERKRAEEAARLLADASRALASSLDYEATLAEIVRLLVPRFADWCTVDVLAADGTIRRIAAEHSDPAQAVRAREMASRFPPGPNHPVRRVLESGKPVLLAEVTEATLRSVARNPEQVEVMREMGIRSAMIVPLPARGGMIGAIMLGTADPNRRYGPADLSFAEDLAGRAALAVDNARLFQEVRRRGEDLQALSAQLSAAEEAERRRMAHDIHDSIGQTLSVIRLNLDAVVRNAGAGGGPLREALAPSLALLEDVQRQARTLVLDLYPAMLDDLGLTPTLQWYAEQFATRTGIPTAVSSTGRPRTLPTAISGYLFRAVKELLNNAAKHAGAREVVVAVRWQTERLRIVVADDGCGFEPNRPPPGRPPGMGLAGIRERLAGLGGQFFIESEPGRGAQAILDIPLPPQTDGDSRAVPPLDLTPEVRT